MTDPKTDTEPKKEIPNWVWVVFLIVVFGVLGTLSNRSSSPEHDPCSSETLEAPYEVGSKYQYRDQAAERHQRCLDARLDSFGE